MAMRYRTLGRTGLRVSEIGLGGIPIQKIPKDDAVAIIRKCAGHGVNFVDTGTAYTDSEEKIGEAVKGQREKWILASKSPALHKKQMAEEIEKSLRQLGVDYIELYQVHHVKEKAQLDAVLSGDGALAAMEEAKRAGKIGFIGITGHNNEVLLEAAKTGRFDTVLMSYNAAERGAEQELLPYCRAHDIGVLVMKPLAGGQIKSASAAVKFVLKSDAVSTVIPGVHTEKELEEDIVAVLADPEFTKKDEDSLLPDVEKLGGYVCRQCGYCVSVDGGCPKGINIMGFMRLDAYNNTFGRQDWVLDEYAKQQVKPGECIFCGHCEKACPYDLPIMRILRDMKVRDAYEKLPRGG